MAYAIESNNWQGTILQKRVKKKRIEPKFEEQTVTHIRELISKLEHYVAAREMEGEIAVKSRPKAALSKDEELRKFRNYIMDNKLKPEKIEEILTNTTSLKVSGWRLQLKALYVRTDGHLYNYVKTPVDGLPNKVLKKLVEGAE